MGNTDIIQISEKNPYLVEDSSRPVRLTPYGNAKSKEKKATPKKPIRSTSNSEKTSSTVKTTSLDKHTSVYEQEISAAHTAIVLAKTQATAAREETKDLAEKLQDLQSSFDREIADKERLSSELTSSRKSYIELDKELAVERARIDEIRTYADQEHKKYLDLLERCKKLEVETDREANATGWNFFRKSK